MTAPAPILIAAHDVLEVPDPDILAGLPEESRALFDRDFTADEVADLNGQPDAVEWRADQADKQAQVACEQRMVLFLLREAARLAAAFAAEHDACCDCGACEPRLHFFLGGKRDAAGRAAARERNETVAGVAFMALQAAVALESVTPDGPLPTIGDLHVELNHG